MTEFLIYLKITIFFIGTYIIYLGTLIEPSVGVWVVSFGGSLLTISIGQDRNFLGVVLGICLGLSWGIFGSEVIHSMYPFIPQAAGAFFSAIFGGEMTYSIINSIKGGSITDFMVRIISTITESFSPFKNKGEKK